MHILKKLKKFNPYAEIANNGLLSDVQYYIDTGSYLFNGALSGSIYKGFPGNRIVGLAGPPSAGKTMMTIEIVKNFLNLNENNYAIYNDTECRLQRTTLLDRGVPVDRFLHNPVKTLEDFKNQSSQMIDTIKKEHEVAKEKGDENIQKFFFVLDSLGQPPSSKEVDDANRNHNAMEMGLRAKTIRSIFRILAMDLGILQMPMIVTSHTYDNPSNQYAEKGISGGKGLLFAASLIVQLNPKKDKDKDKKNVVGILMEAYLRKSDITKQYKKVPIRLHFDKGLDRYYGLMDFGLNHKLFKKEGKKIILPDERKFYSDDFLSKPEEVYTKEILDQLDILIQKEFSYGKENLEIDSNEEKVEKKKIAKKEETKNEELNDEDFEDLDNEPVDTLFEEEEENKDLFEEE